MWAVTLNNDELFDEFSILRDVENPSKLTPWLLLDSYCSSKNLIIKEIKIWDDTNFIKMYSPNRMGSASDSIDYRKRYISEGMHTNIPRELEGFIVTKNKVSFGIWLDKQTKEIFTTVE